MKFHKFKFIPFVALLVPVLAASCGEKRAKVSGPREIELQNVSYDPTREFYEEINPAFAAKWAADGKGTVKITQSHGGSGKQARSVIDGQPADVVTLALAGDIDVISKEAKLLPADWQKKLPENSSPYTSTIVFVVRKGNPKQVKDWGDLVQDGIGVITPNPKTSGGAQWNYLAAWAWASKQFAGDEAKTLDFVKRLYKNVPVLDSGARAATTTFAANKIGDVFLSWENEAHLIAKQFPGQTEIVYPSLTILAEPTVAVVEKNAAKHDAAEAAEAYLKFLYTDEAQELAAKHFYRPRNAAIAAKFTASLPIIPLVTVDKDFGGWAAARAKHFADGGTFDKIYQK